MGAWASLRGMNVEPDWGGMCCPWGFRQHSMLQYPLFCYVWGRLCLCRGLSVSRQALFLFFFNFLPPGVFLPGRSRCCCRCCCLVFICSIYYIYIYYVYYIIYIIYIKYIYIIYILYIFIYIIYNIL